MSTRAVYLFPVLILTLLLTLQVPETKSAKILSVTFFGSRSHKITYEALMYKLAERGHDVTILSQGKPGKKVKNMRDIVLFDLDDLIKKNQMLSFFERKEKNIPSNPFKLKEFIGSACAQSYDMPIVQEILKEKFDLVFTEAIFNECVAGLIHKLNTTLITISPTAAPTFVTRLYGSPSPLSFVPSMFGAFTDKMTFKERTINLLTELMLKLVQDWSFKPAMEELYREKLNDSTIPSSDEIFGKASMVLSCSHFSTGQPRPFLPDIVEVGGMHLTPAKPLPQDLMTFADSAGSDGFIYFSMGSAIKGSEMPDKYRQIFVRVFGRLKQKVLWKWETEQMEGLPGNVKLGKWLPQQHILGHPNCKLFITHGGLGGTTEAIYHGVPLLGFPMFGDQNLNMQKAQTAGYAQAFNIVELDEEVLYETINQMVNEPRFRDRVQHLSKVYRDQFGNPLDRAVFWTEYVLRHKGAPHLRSPARDLNFLQYHSLDVIFTLLAIVFTIFYLVFVTCRFGYRKLCGGSSSHSSTNQRKKISSKKND